MSRRDSERGVLPLSEVLMVLTLTANTGCGLHAVNTADEAPYAHLCVSLDGWVGQTSWAQARRNPATKVTQRENRLCSQKHKIQSQWNLSVPSLSPAMMIELTDKPFGLKCHKILNMCTRSSFKLIFSIIFCHMHFYGSSVWAVILKYFIIFHFSRFSFHLWKGGTPN